MTLIDTARTAAATARSERTTAFEARDAASSHHLLTQQRQREVKALAAFDDRTKKPMGVGEIAERRTIENRIAKIDAALAELGGE